MKMSVFEIKVRSSSLTRVFTSQVGVLKEVKLGEEISLKSIIMKILKGNNLMMNGKLIAILHAKPFQNTINFHFYFKGMDCFA